MIEQDLLRAIRVMREAEKPMTRDELMVNAAVRESVASQALAWFYDRGLLEMEVVHASSSWGETHRKEECLVCYSVKKECDERAA